MRKAVLFRSVARVLATDEPVHEAVYMWARHRYMIPYAVVAFVGLFWVAELTGFEDLAGRFAIGFGGAAISVAATTDYRVLAETPAGRFLFKASRIRHVAVSLMERLPHDVVISHVGGNVLASDWQVGDRRYTITRSGEQSMNRLAATA